MKDLVNILERNGFKRIRRKGSHWVFYNEKTNKQTIIPFHNKDLPKGTFYEILKQSGLKKEDII